MSTSGVVVYRVFSALFLPFHYFFFFFLFYDRHHRFSRLDNNIPLQYLLTLSLSLSLLHTQTYMRTHVHAHNHTQRTIPKFHTEEMLFMALLSPLRPNTHIYTLLCVYIIFIAIPTGPST